jgi:hypothetical protein
MEEDVGMAEAGGQLDLAQESLGAEGGHHLGAQGLERDLAVVAQVASQIHDGHPAPADLAHERVAPREGRLKPLPQVHDPAPFPAAREVRDGTDLGTSPHAR